MDFPIWQVFCSALCHQKPPLPFLLTNGIIESAVLRYVADAKTIETVRDILTKILNSLEFPFDKVEVTEEMGEVVRANIETERAPFLIGTHGDRLSALQQVVKSMLWSKGLDEKTYVVVDIDHYKKNRQDRMIALAEEKAEAARQTQMIQQMPMMEPILRRMVHLHLAQESFSDLSTESVGEAGYRRLQIVPANVTSISASSDLPGDDEMF